MDMCRSSGQVKVRACTVQREACVLCVVVCSYVDLLRVRVCLCLSVCACVCTIAYAEIDQAVVRRLRSWASSDSVRMQLQSQDRAKDKACASQHTSDMAHIIDTHMYAYIPHMHIHMSAVRSRMCSEYCIGTHEGMFAADI
jgi:hypothetical protein